MLCRRGNTTAGKRSKLIATIWKTDVVHETWDKIPNTRSRLAVHLWEWKNILWLMISNRRGVHWLKWRLDQRSLSWIKGSCRLGVDGNLIPKRKRWHWLWSVECHEPLEENSNSHVVCCVCLFYDSHDGLRLQKKFWPGGLLILYIICHRLPETNNEPFFSQYLVSFVRFTEVVACCVWIFR